MPCSDLYYTHSELSDADNSSSNVQISPAMYLQYVTTLSKTYVKLFSSIEETRNRLEKIQHKLENVSGQVEELAQELNDLQPRFAQITAEIETKKETVGQLSTTRASVLANHKELDTHCKELKIQLDKIQAQYDDAMGSDLGKVMGMCQISVIIHSLYFCPR